MSLLTAVRSSLALAQASAEKLGRELSPSSYEDRLETLEASMSRSDRPLSTITADSPLPIGNIGFSVGLATGINGIYSGAGLEAVNVELDRRGLPAIGQFFAEYIARFLANYVITSDLRKAKADADAGKYSVPPAPRPAPPVSTRAVARPTPLAKPAAPRTQTVSAPKVVSNTAGAPIPAAPAPASAPESANNLTETEETGIPTWVWIVLAVLVFARR